MIREGKPKGFFYLDHRSVDGRHAIITDIHATAADVHDGRPYLARLDRQIERFGFNPFAVGLDAGYATTDKHGFRHHKSDPAICRGCPLLASCTVGRNTQHAEGHHPPRLAGRQGSGRRQPPHRLGQTHLQAPEGDSPALLRRRQSSSTAAATPASATSSGWPGSACSPPPPSASRRWP